MPQCPRCAAEVPSGNRFCGRCGDPASSPTETSTVVLAHGAAGLSSTPTPDEGRFPPGTILSQRYRIAGRLGQGGMGEVYRAGDLLLGQTVALKFLPQKLAGNEAALDRLRSEVRLARQISHPNVCRVYDIGEAGGQLFLSMEFIDGEDLASLMRRIGRLPSAKALEIARRLCAGLAAAHEKNVLHRDLKPGNIMIDGRGQVLITDFGLASVASQIRPADVQSGTPAYMSPEQLAGVEVTQRSDLYSLGLVLYELFSGAAPHAAPGREQLAKLRQAAPPLLADSVPDVDPAVDRVVTRCLDPDPAKRPSSALAVAAALPGGDPLAAALAMGETPSPALVAAAEPSGSMRPRVAAACFVALAVLMICNAWLLDSVSMYSSVAGIDPAVMAQSARDMLAGLGYGPQRGWSEWAYNLDSRAVDQLIRLDAAAVRRRIAEDPPAYFWYRSSPAPMVAAMDPFQPFVTQVDPALTAPGMILVRLDAKRRLLLLEAVPPERDDSGHPAAQLDWSRLWAAAGLDAARFSPASPQWTPPTAFDARAAWLETHGADPLRVEAATWRGLPVFFKTARNSTAGPPAPPGPSSLLIYETLILAIIVALVWLNVRKRRGDLRGAARFGLFIAVAVLVYQLLGATHTTDLREFGMFAAGSGNALWSGAYSAMGYLAFEPFVRRKWPHALISWTRLLDGRFRDPLVGQHILIGLLAGAATAAVVGLLVRQVFGASIPSWYAVSSSPIHLAEFILGTVPQTAIATAGLYCLVFVAIAVSRIGWAGACLTAAIVTAIFSLGAPHLLWTAPVSFLLYTAAMLFALRFGPLALAAAVLVRNCSGFPLTLDRSEFYFGPSLAILALIIGLGAWAWRNAIAAPRPSQSSGGR